MGVAGNLHLVEERIARACQRAGRSPDEVTLVAVTKTVPAAAIEEAFAAGIRNFGENRVQEARAKVAELEMLRQELTWHMVGHLQTNKAKTATEIFDIIHSVDSLRLAEMLNKRAQWKLPVLLQVNAAAEETKGGFVADEVGRALAEISRLPHLDVVGLMTMAPFVADPEEVRWVFRRLRELGDSLGLEHLSMGMSDDFEVAIEEGATLVRIGRAIFGERPV